MMRTCVGAMMMAFIPLVVKAQAIDANLQSMVVAEEAFIKMAGDKSTKEAFLFFLADDAITVGPYGPEVGTASIRKQPASRNLLTWHVAYCDIATSGEFGYTTGPWEYRNDRSDSVPAAYGDFHSVWRKQPDGKWKNIADIGVSHDSPTPKQTLSTSAQLQHPSNTKTQSATAIVSLMNQENAFLDSYKKNGLAAYKTVVSSQVRFARPDEFPIVSEKDKMAFYKGINPYYNVQLVDGGIASSGDMGFMYGSADVVVLKDGNQEKKKATYLRIWKKEGIAWKITLDVMTYQ